MWKGSMVPLSSVRVTVLCENTACGCGVIGEHGLSWWIEAEGKHVLFDLGQGIGLLANAKRLGVDLNMIDAVAISHGHYDHVGGWAKLPVAVKAAPHFMHTAALSAKFQCKNEGVFVSASDASFSSLCSEAWVDVREVREPTEVVDGIWMSGEIPRLTDYEDSGGAFYRDKLGKEVDPLLDDQALFFDTSEGLVVILGCSHAGVVNTLRYLMKLSGRRIHAAVGGMHLVNASEERIRRTVEDLLEINPDWLGANHCTGSVAQAKLIVAFGERYLQAHAGQSIRFPIRSEVTEGTFEDAKTL